MNVQEISLKLFDVDRKKENKECTDMVIVHLFKDDMDNVEEHLESLGIHKFGAMAISSVFRENLNDSCPGVNIHDGNDESVRIIGTVSDDLFVNYHELGHSFHVAKDWNSLKDRKKIESYADCFAIFCLLIDGVDSSYITDIVRSRNNMPIKSGYWTVPIILMALKYWSENKKDIAKSVEGSIAATNQVMSNYLRSIKIFNKDYQTALLLKSGYYSL